jgi:type II secretory pathway component PulF
MAVFRYRAKLEPRRVLEGTVESPDRRSAILELTRKGYSLISIEPQEATSRPRRFLRFGAMIRRGEITLFTNQLADLIESGLPVYQALTVIAGQTPNGRLRVIISEVAGAVRNGASLSSALGRHPRLFPTMYTGMVRSGEGSGTLAVVLKRLHGYLEQTDELQSRIKTSLVYPSFVFIMGIASIIVLLTLVIPRLLDLFEDMGRSLPLPTRVIIAASSLFSAYWWIFAPVILLLAAFYTRRKSIPLVRAALERLKLNMPVVRDLHLKRELGEYARTMATLLDQRIPMIDSLNIATNAISNEIVKRRMSDVAAHVANGEKVHGALGRTSLFSPFMINILSVGEEGGRLDQAFNKVADIYQKEIATTTRRLMTLLEPAIILVLALGLGFIIFAIVTPIFQIDVFEL